MTSKPQKSIAFRFSLKALLCIVLLTASYLGGRESQQSTIREQSERLEQLEAELTVSDKERVIRAQQLANMLAQNRQLSHRLRGSLEERTEKSDASGSADQQELR